MIPHHGDEWVSLICNGIQMTFPRRMNEEATNAAIRVNLKADPVFLWKDYNHNDHFLPEVFLFRILPMITISTGALDIEALLCFRNRKCFHSD
jgi:hypothetical protein